MLSTLITLLATTSVVVFSDRAQVTRSESVTCPVSKPVVFTGISAHAVADSFRARTSSGSVDGIRPELIRVQDDGATFRAQLAGLQRERDALDDEDRRITNQFAIAKGLAEITTDAISREMLLEKPNTKAWQSALDTSLTKSLALSKSRAALESKRRALNLRQRDLKQPAAEKRAYSVEVFVTCAERATVELTYTSLGASWEPSYEARVGTSSVELSTYATVIQNTGETWADAELTLSTATPSQNASPPQLNRLIVNAYEQAPHKKVLVRRDEAVKHADQSVTSGASEEMKMAVAERVNIPSDGQPTRIFVGKSKLKATFELRATPKLAPVAFRVAQLTNQMPWPLLAGRVDIFRSTGLVGQYEIQRIAQGEPFALTLGIEDAVRIKRVVSDEVKKEPGLFSKARFHYAYRFEVANYGDATTLMVTDHLPVSELEDLTVKVGEKTTPGYELLDGLATWHVPLKNQEKKNITFEFAIEVPGSYDTNSL